MSFLQYKKNLNPIVALISTLIIMVFGLVMSTKTECSYFLIGTTLWLVLFGCYKQLYKLLIVFILFGGFFAIIAYFTMGRNLSSAISMLNRFGTVFLAIVPSTSIQAVAMTRNLSQIKVPRYITLGMLITMSFIPVLKVEIKRVREAMKTRGAGSLLNPKIFYRAFLIPLVTRIVDISDTLSLSVETRGFTSGKSKYTIYKKETINILDIMYLLGFVVSIVLMVVL